MTAFMKCEVRKSRPKFNRLRSKMNADWLFDKTNSSPHVDYDSEGGDLIILILFLVCAFLFWM